jgi:hypothetical protein
MRLQEICPGVSRLLSILALALLCALAFAARCHTVRDVLVEGRIYFADADCYSRMTRARMAAEEGHLFIRTHRFENWPAGTRPHTTAPLDWLIVATKTVLDGAFTLTGATSVLRNQTLDLAGALIAPILGLLTCAWLGWWARLMQRNANAPPAFAWPAGTWLAVPFFFAISPILVHGTLLGRPDHQALLLLLLSVALGAELILARSLSRRWAIVAGVAWACALWVSLYEPLVLFGIVSAVWGGTNRRRFAAVETRPGWIIFVLILAVAFACEGWRISWPDETLRHAFGRWKQTVGELAPLDPRGPLLYRWLGAGVVITPVLLGLTARRDRLSLAVATVLIALFALTLWQLRWGYFLALGFAMSLPWQLAAWRRAWIAWPVFVLALWPMAQDWDEKLFPEDHPELGSEKRHGVHRLEGIHLRGIAESMRSPEPRPFIAPWWLSPSLAYWSRQPGIAGSSHQSLPGISRTARFFLAAGPDDAERLAREFGAKWIVTDDPDRLVETSRQLLGESGSFIPYVSHLHEHGTPRERVNEEDLRAASPQARQSLIAMADRAEADELGSSAFSCVVKNQFYKLFAVKEGSR